MCYSNQQCVNTPLLCVVCSESKPHNFKTTHIKMCTFGNKRKHTKRRVISTHRKGVFSKITHKWCLRFTYIFMCSSNTPCWMCSNDTRQGV